MVNENRFKLKTLIRTLIIVVSAIALIYFGLVIFYSSHYTANTWINGYYCTGMKPNEALETISADDIVPNLTLVMDNGKEYTLKLDGVDFTYDYGDIMDVTMKNQNQFAWFTGFWNKKEYNITPSYSIAKKDLREAFFELQPIKNEINTPINYELQYSESKKQFVVRDNLTHRLDYEKAFNDFYNSIENGDNTFVIDESYYQDHEPDYNEMFEMDLFEIIDSYQNCDLVYDMGDEQIAFTPEIMLGFLSYDDEGDPVIRGGELVIDAYKINDFLSNLSRDYDSYYYGHVFKSTLSGEVQISDGDYYTELDNSAEYLFLVENLLKPEYHDGVKDIHTPSYRKTAYSRGKSDIGKSYIEIDLTNQHLFYYLKGELIVDCDIISGDVRTGSKTATGVYSVKGKEEQRYLTGHNFTNFVNYWIPFNDDSGVCDATWRDEFGGDIYLSSGSHGSVLIPFDAVIKIYESIETGMPVVVF